MSRLARVQPADTVKSQNDRLSLDDKSLPIYNLAPSRKANTRSSLSGSSSRVSVKLPSDAQAKSYGNGSPTTSGKQVVKAQKILSTSKRFRDSFLDAIYLVCPECSLVQCSAIALGLLMAIILTLVLLFYGSYWTVSTEKMLLLKDKERP